jgi:putative transposase
MDSALPAAPTSGDREGNSSVLVRPAWEPPFVSRCGEPRFVCEIELRASAHDRHVVRNRMEAARQLYNAVLRDLLRRLDTARRDPAWGAAHALAKGPMQSAAFRELRTRYGLSEYAAHKQPSLHRQCWIRGHLDSNTAQKVATAAWQAVEAHMFGHHRRPRLRRRGDLRSVEGKKPDVGIRLLAFGNGDAMICWDGAHARLRMPLMVLANDALHNAALSAPVRYVRIVRREIRGRERMFSQLVCAGRPPVKRAARAEGRFGIDVGPSWIAVSDSAGNATRHKLAPGASAKGRVRRRYQRKLDRQRRSNNPDCYDQRGRVIRGKRPRGKSRRMRATERQLAENQRQLTATPPQ